MPCGDRATPPAHEPRRPSQVGGPCKRRPERPPAPDGFSLETGFRGAREGYVFTTQFWGTGYYRDERKMVVPAVGAEPSTPLLMSAGLPKPPEAGGKGPSPRSSPRGSSPGDLFERSVSKERGLSKTAMAAVEAAPAATPPQKEITWPRRAALSAARAREVGKKCTDSTSWDDWKSILLNPL